MSYRKSDYLVTIEWYGNQLFKTSEQAVKKVLIRGCSTLNEVNQKLYESVKLKRSQWTITKIERLGTTVEIVE